MNDPLRHVVGELRERVASGDDLVRAFAVWLGVATDEIALGSTGLWLPREVATAGLLRGAGRSAPRPFSAGLGGLMRCAYFDPNLPPGFESDPLAMFGVAVGVQSTGTAAARAWLLDLLDRALAGERDDWRVALLQAGRNLLGEPSDAGVVLRVALATRGLASPAATDIEEAVRVAASTSPCLPDQAAVRLAVLNAAARLAATPHRPRHTTSESPVKLVSSHPETPLSGVGPRWRAGGSLLPAGGRALRVAGDGQREGHRAPPAVPRARLRPGSNRPEVVAG